MPPGGGSSNGLALWFRGRFDNLVPPTSESGAGRTSGSVSELLLDRYRDKGQDFLDGLTGVFAVALSDPANDVALIARDGMGNGYLAYRREKEHLAASSNDQALLRASRDTEPLCTRRLAEFFSFDELSSADTFFERVKALLPGEMVILQAGLLRRRWLARPSPEIRIERAHWEEYVEEFAELLEGSVQRCLVGLDRVSVLLSGGLDSTPIAALAARHLSSRGARAPVTAVCWKFTDPRGDESELIRRSADELGFEIEWIDCDDAVPFLNLADWPIHPASPEQTAFRWFHQRSYARAAELGHSVILSGFCGDALYVSPRRWLWDLLAAEGPGRAIDRLREVALEIGWKRTLRTQVFGPLLPRMRGLRRELPSHLTLATRQRLAARPRWPANLESARRPRQAERVLALLDAHGMNVERHYTEPFGLEMRTPLRDFALAQFMLAVPDHLLRQGTETRPILRAATRGLIPDSVRLRKGKAAFHDVLDRGMATEKLRWAKPLLLDPDALWRGYIEESAIRSWIESSPTDNWGKMGYLHAIYGELWRRERAGLSRPLADAVD